MGKFCSKIIACLLIFSGQSNLLAGQSTAPAIKDTTRGPATFAMIMGISTYKYIRPLAYADSDAELFRDFLKSPGGGKVPDSNIYFLKNEEAKAANFFVKGMSWLRNKNLKAGDRLYIYLAGHGDAINQDEFFFLAYDCNPAGDKNNYLITGTIQLYNVKVRIAEASRKGVEVFFIMDACRTNELPGGDEGQELLNNAISEKKAGEIIMLATGAGQESLEDAGIGTGHGLFTYYLVEGLSGLADSTGKGDNLVTLEELQRYVGLTVPNVAQSKYKKKQDPFICCDENKQKVVSKVDTAFMRKWLKEKQSRGQIGEGGFNSLALKTFRTRGGLYAVPDTIIIDLYNEFNRALKALNLTGNNKSAESYYQELAKIDPKSSYTIDAKMSLATEFINFAQSKVNLYLEGKDVSAVQGIRSQLDDEEKTEDIGSSVDRMEKVARREFSEVGEMVEKAINYLASEEESSSVQSLQAMNFFFKAHGYFEKSGGKHIDLKQAIQFAYSAYKADPNAAYILNTLASLQLDNNKPDSTIFFAKRAIATAPQWRYPYMNVANAYNRLNKSDSALVYFRKAVSVDPNRSDAYVDLGFFYFQRRNLDSARANYEKALRLDPGNVYAHNNMGWLEREKKEYQKALNYFRKSLSLDPKFFNAYNGISRVFTDMRMFDSARYYYHKAQQNYPDKLITSNYLGQFYQETNRLDSAKAYFIQAAVYDPSYDAPYINLGKLYTQSKQFDSARFYYHRAIDLNVKNFRGYNQLGLMFNEIKQFDSAQFYLRKAIQMNPDNTIVLNNIGISFLDQKKSDSAARYFKRVIQLQPENAYAFNNLGNVFRIDKQLDSAKEYYKKALALKSDLPSANINMGQVLASQKDFEGAKKYLIAVVEANPENMDALKDLENVFKQMKEYDSAIYYYIRALDLDVQTTFIYNNLGRLYLAQEKYDLAVQTYIQSIQLDPKNTPAYNNLGEVYVSLEQYDSAVVVYKKALEIDPEYYNAYFNLGITFNRMKQYDSSIAYFRRAIQLNPQPNITYYLLAGSYARNNKTEEALSNLKLALEKGYDNYEYIIVEPDLDSIRKNKAYKDMMKKYFPKKYKESDDQ